MTDREQLRIELIQLLKSQDWDAETREILKGFVSSLTLHFKQNKLVRDATFIEMNKELVSVLKDEDRIWWTSKDQIMKSIEENPDKFITSGSSYFFFCKEGCLVFNARFIGGKVLLEAHDFKGNFIWHAQYNHSVVLPQIESMIV